MAEIELSALNRQCLSRRIATLEELQQADLDNGIACTAIGRKEKVRRVEREKAMETFVERKLESFYGASMNEGYLG